jgi:hypothetical protein
LIQILLFKRDNIYFLMTTEGVSSKLKKALLSFDLIGPDPKLILKEGQKFNTYLGLLFSAVCFALSLVIVRFIFFSYVNKSDPDVGISPIYLKEPIVFNRSSFKLFITITSVDPQSFSFTPIPKSELFPPALLTGMSNSSGLFLNPEIIPLSDCGNDVFEDYNSGFIDKSKSLSEKEIAILQLVSFCLPANFSFSLNSFGNTRDQLQIAFPYEPYSLLMKKYPIIGLQLNYRQVFLNPGDIQNYYKLVWTQQLIPFDLDYQTMWGLELQNYTLTMDSTDFIFTKKRTESHVSPLTFKPVLNVKRNDKTLGLNFLTSLSLIKTEYSTITLIRYKSMNDVIAAFGGTFSVLTNVAKILLLSIVNNFYSPYLINEIFSFHTNQNMQDRKMIKNKILESNRNRDCFNLSINDNLFVNSDSDAINTERKRIYVYDMTENKCSYKKAEKETGINQINDTSGKIEETKKGMIINNSGLSPEIQKLLKEVQGKLSQKKTYKITVIDYIKNASCSKCYKNKERELKCLIIKKCEERIRDQSYFSTVIKNGFDISCIKRLLSLKYPIDLMEFSSFNVESYKTLNILNCKHKEEEKKYDEKILIEFLKCDMNSKLNRMYLKQYLNSKL